MTSSSNTVAVQKAVREEEKQGDAESENGAAGGRRGAGVTSSTVSGPTSTKREGNFNDGDRAQEIISVRRSKEDLVTIYVSWKARSNYTPLPSWVTADEM